MLLLSGCVNLRSAPPGVTSGTDTHTLTVKNSSSSFDKVRIYHPNAEGDWVILHTAEDVTVTDVSDPNDPYSSGIYDMEVSKDLAWNTDGSKRYLFTPLVQSGGVYVEDTTRNVEVTADGSAFEVELDHAELW